MTNRRKFYIVQNGGSPAEMYCTDLVHRAKHGNGCRRHVDESRLMKCVDKWREEWNHGVQMPISCERPPYRFEQIHLFPDLNTDKYQPPAKYMALYDRKYTDRNSQAFERCERFPLYNYEIDSVDEDWLTSKEGGHISKHDFLCIMDQLEVDCYRNIHLTILEQLTYVRDNAKADDDADCDICCMPEWEPGDEIVFCDACNISVHQSCYGLDSLPTDDWMCATCIHRRSLARGPLDLVPLPACVFCPILGGAMKSTKNAETWAHVVCALWIPEVRFADVERREPITHLSDVPADRWKAKCSVCDTCNGACIRCTYDNCNVPFHVSCAQRSGLIFQIEQNPSALNGVQMTSYCVKHSLLSPCRSSMLSRRSSGNFTQFDLSQLDKMKLNFFKHVDLQTISQKTEISEKIVNDVFTYWHWKRKLNSGQPLMVEPLAIKLSVQPKQIRAAQRAAKAKQKMNALSALPSEELLKGFEKIRQIRLNLETNEGQVNAQKFLERSRLIYPKARNLCYMVSRREKLKKSQLETFERITSTMGDLLLDPVVPCSKRRTDKLLEVWDSTNKEILPSDEEYETIMNCTNSIISNVKSSLFSEDNCEKSEKSSPIAANSAKVSQQKMLRRNPHGVETGESKESTPPPEIMSDTIRLRSNRRELPPPNSRVISAAIQPRNGIKATIVADEPKRREDPFYRKYWLLRKNINFSILFNLNNCIENNE